MKTTNNSLWWMTVLFALILGIGLYWITFLNHPISSPNDSSQAKVRFYYEELDPTPTITPEPSFENQDGLEKQTSSTLISHATENRDGENTRSLYCEIRDVLGDPVGRGTVRVGERELEFVRGECIVSSLQPGRYSIVASARGYRPSTVEIAFPETRKTVLTLDYECDFDIQVFQENVKRGSRTPQANAVVSLYQVELCKRPLEKIHQLAIQSDVINNPYTYTVQYKNGSFVVTGVDKASHEIYNSGNSNDSQFDVPVCGDSIESIGYCGFGENSVINLHPLLHFMEPLSNRQNRNARIMDTIQLCLNKGDRFTTFLGIHLIHEGGQFCNTFCYLPSMPDASHPHSQSVTDESGRCKFNNLPPGLYYAQAKYEGRCSMIRPLVPSTGGAKLFLDSKSDVRVFTLKKGIPYFFSYMERIVPNSKVTLKSKDPNQGGFRVKNTGIAAYAEFDSVPYGEYALTVEPPKDTGLQPIAKEISVNVPQKTVPIFFDDASSRHRIEGTVVECHSLSPIEGIQIELFKKAERGSNYRFCGSVQTDRDGCFSFTDILSGFYQLRSIPDFRSEPVYTFHKEDREPDSVRDAFYNRTKDDIGCQIDVSSEPVYSVQLKMIGTIQTNFSGRVVDTKNQSKEGAVVTFLSELDVESESSEGKKSYWSISNDGRRLETKCDREGTFSISIWTKDVPGVNDIVFSGKITANVFQRYASNPVEYTPGESTNITEFDYGLSITPSYTGVLEFPFQIGKDRDDLIVVVDDSGFFTVFGRVRSEGGGLPSSAKIGAIQGESAYSVKGFYDPSNGEFEIPGVKNEPFRIKVLNSYFVDGNDSRVDYEDVSVSIDFAQANEMFDRYHNNGDQMKVEITVKESGFLQGVLVDSDQNPLSDCGIVIETSGFAAEVLKTDSNGRFLIRRLSKNNVYSLYGKLPYSSNQPTVLAKDLLPNLENIVLVWPE